MKRLVLLIPVLMVGCTSLGPEQVAAYASITEGIVRTQLTLKTSTMTDDELRKWHRAISIAKPLTASAASLTSAYLTDLNDEMARRNISP